MSIQQVQTKNLLELIAQSFFVSGINPQSTQLYDNLSFFFSKHPAGSPLALDVDMFRNLEIADVEVMNDFMALMVVNLDTLYEVAANHIDEMLMLNTVLRTHLDRLKTKRKALEQRIDDYLLGLYNSDGYFYSSSDDFSQTFLVDFKYTSAFVDTAATTVSIPAVSSLSHNVSPDKLAAPNLVITDANNNVLSYTKKSDFANAIDGMTNTAWFVEVSRPVDGPLTATIEMQISTAIGDNTITRIDLTPFGVTPVQCAITAKSRGEDNVLTTAPFTNSVKTSTDKMSFVGEQITGNVENITLQLTKATPDYTQNNPNRLYTYVFGFKEILMTEQVYDSLATFVSQPFGIPSDLEKEAVIDAVSLVVDEHIPTNTSIQYFVAADNVNAASVNDFDWKPITPISGLSDSPNAVVNFEGATVASQMIRRAPRSSGDKQMIAVNTTSPDLSKRNPTPSYISGADVYRITSFTDDFLAGTINLEEGINTTRIYYTELDPLAISTGFTFWKTKFDTTSYFTSYGQIDTGHEFFYGSDVGEDGKSVYVETFLEAKAELPLFLKECRKSDVNSRQWDVRLFLNGREIANLPVGVDRLTVPWKLKEGINSIVLMANIPEATLAIPSPYIGTFSIMDDASLTDFGTVKLDNWTYVDLYKFQNNQVNQPNSFTIYNKELISRKQPTNNFRITYKKSTSNSPSNIRVRADLSRSSQYAHATPILDSYRIRFAYT